MIIDIKRCLRYFGYKVDVLIVSYDLHDLPGDIVVTTIRDLSGNIRRTNTVLVSSLMRIIEKAIPEY